MTGEHKRVRVVVADDHPLFRRALVEMVRERPELELVAHSANGREALDEIRAHRPDVAVLDVRMPELGGLDVLNAVVRDELETRIVLLSAFIDRASAPYLAGVTIDYVVGLHREGFKFINPNAARTCGCGESFGVNEFTILAMPGEQGSETANEIVRTH